MYTETLYGSYRSGLPTMDDGYSKKIFKFHTGVGDAAGK